MLSVEIFFSTSVANIYDKSCLSIYYTNGVLNGWFLYNDLQFMFNLILAF